MRIGSTALIVLVLLAALIPTTGIAEGDSCFLYFETARTDDPSVKIRKRNARLKKLASAYLNRAGHPKLEPELFWIANAAFIKDPEVCKSVASTQELMIAQDVRIIRNVPIVLPPDIKRAEAGISESAELVSGGQTPPLKFLGVAAAIQKRNDDTPPVVVGILDTGANFEHPALKGSYRGNTPQGIVHDRSWFDAFGEIFAPDDPDIAQHGTQVTSLVTGHIVSASGEVTLRLGAAIDARWISCRGFQRGNNGDEGDLRDTVACLQWFAAPTTVTGKDPDPSFRPDIINLSGSASDDEGRQMIEDAIRVLEQAGTVVVAAAGNSAPGDTDNLCRTIRVAPQTLDNTITVGALHYFNEAGARLRENSLRGPVQEDSCCRIKPDLVAPGRDIVAACSMGNSDFCYFSDTSAAAPLVAGLIARWMTDCPAVRGKPGTVRRLLREHAQPIPPHNNRDGECPGLFCAGFDKPADCQDCFRCDCGSPEEANGLYGYGYPQLNLLLQADVCVP